LVNVRRLDLADKCALLHLTIQGQMDDALARRLFRYYHRIADRFGRPVATLAVLADAQPDWRPGYYDEEDPAGCRMRFDYPVCKLLDFRRDHWKLERNASAVAALVAAHLAAQPGAHVTSIERLACEEGRQLGLREDWQESIIWLLDVRFGPVPPAVAEQVRAVRDQANLQRLYRQAARLQSLEAFVADLAR
jgi:hypothetical protein